MALKSNLTTNLFITNPFENLAAVDVYNPQGLSDSVITSVKSITEESNIDLEGFLRSTSQASKMIPSIMESAQLLKSPELMNKIAAASNLSNLAMKSLPEGLKNAAMNLYNQYGDTIIKVGTISAKIQDGLFNGAQGIGIALNNIIGQGTAIFNDQDGFAALSLGAIKESLNLGIPNCFDEICSKIQDSDLVMKIANGALPIALEKGDFDLTKTINQYIGNGNLLSNSPYIFNGLSRNFKFPENAFERDKGVFFNKISETFTQIDNKWFESKRLEGNTQTIFNAAPIKDASKDFVETFEYGSKNHDLLDDRYKHLIAAQQAQGGSRFSQSATEDLKKRYPNIF